MIKKLRLKFILTNMLIVLVLLSLLLGMILVFTQAQMEKDNIQMMRGIALRPRAPVLPANAGDMNLPFFRLTVSKEGELLSCDGGYYDLSDEELLYQLIGAADAENKEIGTIDAYHLRFLRHERSENTIYVFSDITSETKAIKGLITNCALIGFTGLGLFLIVSVLLSAWAVHPVAQAWEQQKQFVSDASHELKTPLTVILTNAELLQSGEYGKEESSRFLSSIQTMGQQMRGLVEEMLMLTRAENGMQAKTLQRVNWSGAVNESVMLFEPVFFEKGLMLEADSGDDIFVRGDEAKLRQVTEILLDNARKYCREGTTTRVKLSRKGRSALLEVSDEGEEISREELKKIFRRFYRVDKARTMNHSYGLGLSIAEQIVTGHKGKIWAESCNGVNSFYVQLPCETSGG